ncbi:ATP-dependent chaperone, putative [Trypanosoma cruzi marinkellei]|uniref:ATP-dependent chaperone, putative n=1 Tax=Trypanosoma cruzi marinkellei TaxID=85056 RepID=K2LTM0_TRYCR|nr:ATP-dependent chaperone, putative [Trypanosoma cruzi marinkellei]
MRELRHTNRRNWRLLKHRLRMRCGGYQKAITVFVLLLIELLGFFTYYGYVQNLRYGRTGPLVDGDGEQIVFLGETEPRDAAALGGLTTTVQKYTVDELMAKYDNMDFIYTFVNGSEINHAFRRLMCTRCRDEIKEAEAAFYDRGEISKRPCVGVDIMSGAKTVREFLLAFGSDAPKKLSARDRERDELHYSIRSVEQHMRWHRGRLLIVSPGHNPYWVDEAKNFMASALTSNRGENMRGLHARITTVHQDVLMPYGLRLTVDSHTIEMQLFRVLNITPIHLFLNDDYFVNRDVDISDLLNENGGTYVRTERGLLQKGVRAEGGGAWTAGVRHTNLFNTMELDIHKESYLPENLIKHWENAGYDIQHKIPVASGDNFIYTAHNSQPEKLPPKATPRRPRFFATHAPFVYCTRMFEFFNTRYELELAANTLNNRGRSATDLFTPFVYNAFIMARPWQSSPRFLPYLAALRLSRKGKHGAEPTPPPSPLNVILDNNDACAPATLLRRPASETVYGKFVDNFEDNKRLIQRLKESNPLFFNINDGFGGENSSMQLKEFLSGLFPKPVCVERSATKSGSRESYHNAFEGLMKLPLVIFASYKEAFCPLIRSLRVAMPKFTGPVLLVQDAKKAEGKENDLEKVRKQLNHRVINAMPVVMCSFGKDVKEITVLSGSEIAEEVEEALEAALISSISPVRLPEDYIGGRDAKVTALVIDARTRHPLDSILALIHALEVPGQSLALEDFVLKSFMESKNSFLLLSREDAKRKAVHWVHGASEKDLLLTFPLPYALYEDLDAPVKWSFEE